MDNKRELHTYSLLVSCIKNIKWHLNSTTLRFASSENIALVKIAKKLLRIKYNRKGNCIIPKKKNVVKNERDQSLLRIIPLPTSNANVCVSEDLMEILTVDNNGHVNIFSQLMISDLQSNSNILQNNCAVV